MHAAARDAEMPLDHATLPRRIVELVYADVDEILWPAAELSVRAQLAYLQAVDSSLRARLSWSLRRG